jgi:hypothetical protein
LKECTKQWAGCTFYMSATHVWLQAWRRLPVRAAPEILVRDIVQHVKTSCCGSDGDAEIAGWVDNEVGFAIRLLQSSGVQPGVTPDQLERCLTLQSCREAMERWDSRVLQAIQHLVARGGTANTELWHLKAMHGDAVAEGLMKLFGDEGARASAPAPSAARLFRAAAFTGEEVT